jgi:hypothetical protein
LGFFSRTTSLSFRPATGGGRSEAGQPDALGGYAPPPDGLARHQYTGARFLDLRVAPASDAAEALVDDLVARLLDAERQRGTRRRRRREQVQRQFRGAVAAIAGNLLRAWAEDPPVAAYRSRDVNTIAAEGISWRAFRDALGGMERLGLVRRKRGGKARSEPAGLAARFWPGAPLLRAAAAHGLGPSAIHAAFRRRPSSGTKAPKVKEPLRLKAFKRHRNGRAPFLPIDQADPVAAALRAEVEEINAFAAATPVEGCRPPRWFRQCHGDFRLFGRLCAVGAGNYQSMPAAERVGQIRIAGEPVVEVDIRASLLTLLHGLLRLPSPEGDPYAVPGVPRPVVKVCVNATLGKGSLVRRWSKTALQALPALRDHPAPAVMAAVLLRYPFLAEPERAAEGFRHIADPSRVLIHLLMGIESEVVLDALRALRAEAVLGLPMHDGIIVPASAEARTCELLREAGERVAGVELRLTGGQEGR